MKIRSTLAGAMTRAAVCAVACIGVVACTPSAPAGEETPAGGAPAADLPAPAGMKAAALPAIEPVNYRDPAAWLCRPGAGDACAADASLTIVQTNGTMRVEPFKAAADPPIDCFYVYPTVSLDASPNSDIVPGPEESETARQQASRFGSACRLYAPMYRQVTLSALRELLRGGSPASDREMAYADVRAAWRHYLANDNDGRGVVLVGHSQGAGLLTRLIAAEIDGQPDQTRLVSALLIGSNLEVPATGGSGGSFQNIGLCASAEQTGCAIAYSAFRAVAPPPPESLFGAAPEDGMKAACVNPAQLDESNGALKAYLPANRIVESMATPGPWTVAGETVSTALVAVPGLLSAQCIDSGGFNYLAVTLNADPADARTDVIVGDVLVEGVVQPGWGLHLIDMNLTMGNLVAIVQRQGAAWTAPPTDPR